MLVNFNHTLIWFIWLISAAFAEILAVVLFGWCFSSAARLKHFRNSESVTVFPFGQYFPSPDLAIGGRQSIPKQYRFVIVEHQSDQQVESETYYTQFGDVMQVNYFDGEWAGSTPVLFSL